MIVVKTCPNCGADLVEVVICRVPLFTRYECRNCGWYSENGQEEEIIRIPYGGDTIRWDLIPSACKECRNHPSNGGSGFCNCTLVSM